MIISLGKRCLFGLLYVSDVNSYQFVNALPTRFILRVGFDCISS